MDEASSTLSEMEPAAEVESGAQPTAMEIAEYARYLGMNPVVDATLLWIAEEALCSPLPEDWEEAVRSDGTAYYFNRKERKSTSKHPLEDFYRSLYSEMKEIQVAPCTVTLLWEGIVNVFATVSTSWNGPCAASLQLLYCMIMPAPPPRSKNSSVNLTAPLGNEWEP